MYGLPLLSTEQYFKSINQLEAWRHLLGSHIDPYDKITSPFRTDSHANCYIREYQGVLFFTDHAYKMYSRYTVVKAWAQLYNVSYFTALQMIYEHQYIRPIEQRRTQVVSSGEKASRVTFQSEIHFEPYLYGSNPTFTEIDKAFWSKRGITKEQLLNPTQPVYSVHHYYVNGRLFYPTTYPCYAYHFPDSGHTKLYCPNNPKAERFPASTANADDIWRWLDPTNKVAVVTKSFKDGACVNNLVQADIYAPQSEGVVTQKLLDHLKFYDTTVILYDNDKPGINAANELHKQLPNSKTLFYPTQVESIPIKDTDDMVVNGFSHLAKNLIYGSLQS